MWDHRTRDDDDDDVVSGVLTYHVVFSSVLDGRDPVVTPTGLDNRTASPAKLERTLLGLSRFPFSSSHAFPLRLREGRDARRFGVKRFTNYITFYVRSTFRLREGRDARQFSGRHFGRYTAFYEPVLPLF